MPTVYVDMEFGLATSVAFSGSRRIQVTEEVMGLWEQWVRVGVDEDGLLAGVLADMVEEHVEASSARDRWLRYLRECFVDPRRNVCGSTES